MNQETSRNRSQTWLYEEVVELVNQQTLSGASPCYDPCKHGLLWQSELERLKKPGSNSQAETVRLMNHHVLYEIVFGRMCQHIQGTTEGFSCNAIQDSLDSRIEINSEDEELLCRQTYTHLRCDVLGSAVGGQQNSTVPVVDGKSRSVHDEQNQLSVGNKPLVYKQVVQDDNQSYTDEHIMKILGLMDEKSKAKSEKNQLNTTSCQLEVLGENKLAVEPQQSALKHSKRYAEAFQLEQAEQNYALKNPEIQKQNRVDAFELFLKQLISGEKLECQKSGFLGQVQGIAQQNSFDGNFRKVQGNNFVQQKGFNKNQFFLGSDTADRVSTQDQSGTQIQSNKVDFPQNTDSQASVCCCQQQNQRNLQNKSNNKLFTSQNQSDYKFEVSSTFQFHTSTPKNSNLKYTSFNTDASNSSQLQTSQKIEFQQQLSSSQNEEILNSSFCANSNEIVTCKDERELTAAIDGICSGYNLNDFIQGQGGVVDEDDEEGWGDSSSSGSLTVQGVICDSSNQRRLEGNFGGICVKRGHRLNGEGQYESYSEDDNHGIGYEVPGWFDMPLNRYRYSDDEDEWLNPNQRYCLYCAEVFEFRRQDTKLCETCTKYYRMELAWSMVFKNKDWIDISDIDSSFSPRGGSAPWVGATEETVDVQDSHIQNYFEVRQEFRDRLHEPDLQNQYENFMLYNVPEILLANHEVFKGAKSEQFPRWITRCNLNVVNLRKHNEWQVNFGCMWSHFFEPVSLDHRSFHPLNNKLQEKLVKVQQQHEFKSTIKDYIQEKIKHLENFIFDYKPPVPLNKKKQEFLNPGEMETGVAEKPFPILELGPQVVGKVLERCMRSDLVGFLNTRMVCKTFNSCAQQVACGDFTSANQVTTWDGLYGEQGMREDINLFFCYEARDKVFDQWHNSAFYLPLSLSQIPHTQYFVQRNMYGLELHPTGQDVCLELAQALQADMPHVFSCYHTLNQENNFDPFADDDDDDDDDTYGNSHWGSDSSYLSSGYL